ncbi:16S rRNA (guanine(966)-N(2))-methyltransferase RsmD [Halorhodospira halophila]|uniref:Ribosomal RNA small subunit methyltransferase D n=1 Tax=Halorhodospira halophila (strain DSM 244 / SL1) TaxID=349124 RepID=A1WZF9_HALHL|nr:16S rRNA (guanine(966)-N(2))-methyltransferase RsmD [Halorhodospira halophila]ABM63071.1 16S rRNA m(2)G-966 methyltransferase [Halorhodospira halophila SL1]MBK1727807.1 16S rRNA (guanine(966)-N(2))-methyltransferase RsmD [Halorhodospira halophila]
MSRRRGSQLRIIAGQWRGRRLPIPAEIGVRPTGDRVRETLFNWLAPMLPGARCLDLFAGTGALGLEALSRGAAEVVLVERERRVADTLRRNLTTLGATQARVECADGVHYLRNRPAGGPFEIVLLDPPYGTGLLADCCHALATGGWLAPGAHIYIEDDRNTPTPPLPAGWHVHRQGRAGRCRFQLLRADGANPDED